MKRRRAIWVSFGALLLAAGAVLLLNAAHDLRQGGAPGDPQTSPPNDPRLAALGLADPMPGRADPSTDKDLGYLADPYDLEASGGLMSNRLSNDAPASGDAPQWPGVMTPSAEDDLLMLPGPGRPGRRGTLNLYSPAWDEQPASLTELPGTKPKTDATGNAAVESPAK